MIDDNAHPDRPYPLAHLQVHSHYTLLGATAAIPELVARAAADQMTHLALTDTNALYGAASFHQACLKAGIQPITGMTVTAAAPAEESLLPYETPGQLVLLATGPEGFRSLCRLSALIQASPDRSDLAQRGLDWEALSSHSQGLICLSGGRLGWAERYLRAGNRPAAGRYLARLGGIFGHNAFLSLMIQQPEDQAVAHEVMALGRRFGLPPVAVQPVYYLNPADAPRLRLLAAIDGNIPLAAVPADIPGSGQLAGLHWHSPAQIQEQFRPFPEALQNIGQILDRCRPALPDGRPIWPVLDLPAGQTTEAALARQAHDGLASRYGDEPPNGARARLERELAAIASSGFAPLFLIVADIVHHARSQMIPVSTRGSVANSLVAYCTGITTVDPLVHDLLFERFLNPARANPPDIDLDFCSRRRDEILAYVRRRYGDDRVALVATISTMQPKSAVRETGKAYGLDEAAIKQVKAEIPRRWHPDPRRRQAVDIEAIMARLPDPKQRQVVRDAYELVGQPHHLSIHPGGLVITPGPLTDFVPVQMAPKGFLTTQFDYQSLEAIGLPKLDLLGIRALTVMADAADWIRRLHDPAFELETIPLDDERTGELLTAGQTIGIFQCESAGARRTLRQLKARTITDLAVANAFFKPGPATGGMAATFIRRYRGEEPVRYLHPALEPILAATQGVLLFQEQVLRVATEIAGLSWEQADHLRRGMSKFQAQEMAALRAQFVAGCGRLAPTGPAFTPEQAQQLWEQVLAFAGYGFNRGHATAYADVSYRSAYLKAHWPAEFLCARLADWGGFHHPAVYMAEAVRLGIAVRPPHINHSNRAFALTYEAGPAGPQPVLWMGLGQVRDLRRESVRAIIDQRCQQSFASLPDLLQRTSLHDKEVAHLIRCGALDGLGGSRAALLAQANLVRQAWEHQLLGQPLTVHPLSLHRNKLAGTVSLHELPRRPGRRVTTAAVRLPGWTGGPGFFLGDEQTYIMAHGDDALKTPKAWQPLRLTGRWRQDEWGLAWFQIEELDHL
jgi:DNA polymerase III subunit alpha